MAMVATAAVAAVVPVQPLMVAEMLAAPVVAAVLAAAEVVAAMVEREADLHLEFIFTLITPLMPSQIDLCPAV